MAPEERRARWTEEAPPTADEYAVRGATRSSRRGPDVTPEPDMQTKTGIVYAGWIGEGEHFACGFQEPESPYPEDVDIVCALDARLELGAAATPWSVLEALTRERHPDEIAAFLRAANGSSALGPCLSRTGLMEIEAAPPFLSLALTLGHAAAYIAAHLRTLHVTDPAFGGLVCTISAAELPGTLSPAAPPHPRRARRARRTRRSRR